MLNGKKQKLIFIILACIAFLGALVFVFSFFPIFQNTYGNKEYIFTPEAQESFVAFENIKVSVALADSAELRARGLSGIKRLPENTGMLFLFNEPAFYAFWMKDMKFPIDMIWFRDGVVVEVTRNAEPEPWVRDQNLRTYMPRKEANMMLEVDAVFAEKHDIKIGSVAYIVVRGRGVSAPLDKLSVSVQGSEFFIEVLQSLDRAGKDLKIEKTLAEIEAYTKYMISYKSNGLKISGIMNVPKGDMPKNGFPVLILNHGLIGKDIYFPGRGSKREQDFFARHGYVVIHPDYRGLGESDPDPAAHHDFYVGYSLDVAHLADAVKQSSFSFLNAKRIGMWGHSMGGGIAARVALLRPEIRAFVLFAPISADVEDNFYELTKEEIDWLHKTYGPAGAEVYRRISPITYFSRVSAPVQLHHGAIDQDVPMRFSENMHKTLKDYGKHVEFFMYPNEPHEFIEEWPLAVERALQFFDRYVKE